MLFAACDQLHAYVYIILYTYARVRVCVCVWCKELRISSLKRKKSGINITKEQGIDQEIRLLKTLVNFARLRKCKVKSNEITFN